MKHRVTLYAVFEYEADCTIDEDKAFFNETTNNYWEGHDMYKGTIEIEVEEVK